MAKPLRPFVRGGGYYPSKKWIPLVRNGGYTTQNGGETEPVWATVSGAIASFTTPFAYPLKKLMAEINPVQDLHGYENPWPAGGGKNIYDLDGVLESSGATYTKSGNVYTITANIALFTQPFTFSDTDIEVTISYTDFDDVTSTNIRFDILDANGALVTAIGKNSSPATVTGSKIRFDWSTIGQFTIGNVQIEKGSTASAWSPYSNICPISGWTGLSGQRTGANVLDDSDMEVLPNNLMIARNEGRGGEPFLLKGGCTYTLSCNSSATVDAIYFIKPYGSANDPLAYQFSGKSLTYTPAKDTMAGCVFYWANGRPEDATHIMLNVGSTVSPYEEYTGEAISVNFGQTVYGGSDEVVSGNGTSTMGMVDLGTLEWVYDLGGGQPYFYSMDINAKPKADQSLLNNAICSQYEQTGYGDVNGNNGKFGINANGKYLKVCDTRYTDSSSFKSAMSGVQLCYELATPTTFTHEGQSVDTLVGQNNVWVDTGSVEVTYRIE